MKVNIESNIDQVRRQWAVTRRQAGRALLSAVNETTFEVRRAVVDEMRHVFDRPTPFVLSSVWVNTATDAKPFATIGPRDPGGKSVDPNSVLWAEVFGGRRAAKRAERALQRIGVLPRGFGMVPGREAPLDGYGNVRGSFIVQLLSYFQAFGEQGYRANMTDKRKGQLSRRGRWINGRFVAAAQVERRGWQRAGARAVGQGGIEYFVSHGPGTWGALPSQGKQGRKQHLPRGIWSRQGLYGEDVRLVFLFVPMPSYRRRFDFYGVAERIAQQAFPLRYAARLDAAVARNEARAGQ